MYESVPQNAHDSTSSSSSSSEPDAVCNPTADKLVSAKKSNVLPMKSDFEDFVHDASVKVDKGFDIHADANIDSEGCTAASNAATEQVKDARKKRKLIQIGCGVVGNAYAEAFKNAGHDVVGVEASYARIEELAEKYPMRHISEDLSLETGIDFILLSINTPLDTSTGALNMRYLWSSLGNVTALLQSSPEALVVIRSTVTIGFCESYKAALSERLACPVKVCFQPEFLRAKSALQDATSPWQVVIGCDTKSEVASYIDFQSDFIAPNRISLCTIDEAEIMKIFHNSFNAMKISFFNQAHLLVEEIKAQHGKSIDSHNTFKLIGKTCEGLLNPNYGLTPGHAYYGSCLPKDSAELAHMESSYGLKSNLFAQVVAVNDIMRSTDKEEILHGDNHVDGEIFHSRSKPNEDVDTEAAFIGTPVKDGNSKNNKENVVSPSGVKDTALKDGA